MLADVVFALPFQDVATCGRRTSVTLPPRWMLKFVAGSYHGATAARATMASWPDPGAIKSPLPAASPVRNADPYHQSPLPQNPTESRPSSPAMLRSICAGEGRSLKSRSSDDV